MSPLQGPCMALPAAQGQGTLLVLTSRPDRRHPSCGGSAQTPACGPCCPRKLRGSHVRARGWPCPRVHPFSDSGSPASASGRNEAPSGRNRLGWGRKGPPAVHPRGPVVR